MWGRLSLIVVLLLLNAYFVAVEFALVRVRRSRLEAMSRAGDRIVRFALKATDPRNLTKILSAGQLGITLASLGLGWVAEDALGTALEAWFAELPLAAEVLVRLSAGTAVALLFITYLHVVFGELAPRAVALNHPELFAKWLAPPLYAFAWLSTPFIWVLHSSSVLLLKLFRQPEPNEAESVHSPEELRILVQQAGESGALQTQDARMLHGIFEFSEKNAREVMTPRTAIVALRADASLDDALAVVEEARFSRYPVFDDSIDNVVGMVHAKDLLGVLHEELDAWVVRDVMRAIHVVPGSREVEDVLADFKRLKEHMAVVLDEYGGTAGLVTMEDLLEEIVGEILDEYDETMEMPAAREPTGETLLPGATPIREVNEQYKLALPEDDYTTIGGFVFGALGRLPVVGDGVSGGGARFTVLEMQGRRIETLALEKDKSE